MFCENCGKELSENTQFCENCGTRIGVVSPPPTGYTPKKWITALLLLIFLGPFGAHRFYVRKIGTAIIMLGLTLVGYINTIYTYFTVVASYDFTYFDPAHYIGYSIGANFISYLIGIGLAIWWIIDLVKIWTGKFTDKQGCPLVKYYIK